MSGKRPFALVTQEDPYSYLQMPAFKKSRPRAKKTTKQVGNVLYKKGVVTIGQLGPEIKHVDLVQTAVPVSSGAPSLFSVLSGMPQGTSSTQRVGDRIVIKGINLRLNIFTIANTLNPNFTRWSIVLDKQPDGATSGIANIYSNTTSNNTQLNVANLQRFQVLASGDSGCLSVAGPQGTHFDKFIKCDIGTRFPDATGEATTNGIYLVVTTNATLGNPVYFDCDMRVGWTDA